MRGDFGQSFQYEKPVRTLIGERLLLTVVISLASIVFTYVVSIPIGMGYEPLIRRARDGTAVAANIAHR